MKTQEIRFGVVQWFDAQKNVSKVKISGEPVEADFSPDSRRFLAEGWNVPEFGRNAPIQPFVPRKGYKVVCALWAGYTLEVTSSQRTLRRTMEVVAWDSEESYRDIEKIIASRPVYEVVEFTLYRGQPTSENQRRVVNFGTVQALQLVYPRGEAPDPLAPETTVMNFTYRRRFYKRMPDGRKVQCKDPRPLPEWMAEEPFQPTNERGELLASAEEVAEFVASSRRRETCELARS